MSAPVTSGSPLCISLERDLIRTDLTFEATLALIRNQPLLGCLLPLALVRGKARFRDTVFRLTPLDLALLPLREEVLTYVAGQRANGRPVTLVTSGNLELARSIASHLGVFSDVTTAAEPFETPEWDMSPRRPRFSTVIRAVRAHQWAKNLLVFAPVLLAHRWADPEPIVRTGILFIAFSLLCSAIYILNDLLDIDSDRRHRTKRLRPFAAGDLGPGAGLALAAALLVASAMLTVTLGSAAVAAVLLVYAFGALGYTLWFKRLMIIDVAVLAGLYCVRVYAGAVATDIEVSPWTFAFSLFGFSSLALMKRYSELRALQDAATRGVHGRGYTADDLSMVGIIGVGCGLISVLVVALYITAAETRHLYSRPEVLSLLCPLVLISITRLWILAGRGLVDEDPVLFALHDRPSIALLIGAAIVALVAR